MRHPRSDRHSFLRSAAVAAVLVGSCALTGFARAAPTPEVEIAGLQDVALGSWWGTGPLQGITPACVMSSVTGLYSIEATGSGPGGAFELLGAIVSIPFDTWFNDGTGWIQLSAGVPLSGRSGYDSKGQYSRCLSGRNPASQVRVDVQETDLEASIAGPYSGQLQLLVAPE